MADHTTLGPRLGPQLGHFLPYLLRRRLRAVLWPPGGSERAVAWVLLVLVVLYGAGLGALLNHGPGGELGALLPKVVVGLNATLLVSALLVDFLPALRPVVRPVPEHFPVSARLCVATAFLLDLITLRRALLVAFLLVALAVAPRHAVVPGRALLLVVGAAALSFNLRLLAALGRMRHPLLALHLGSLALLGWWLAHPGSAYYEALGWAAVGALWALWAVQLYWLGPYFSARYLPATTGAGAPSQALAQLSPEWKTYLRKCRLPLLTTLGLKVLFFGVTKYFLGLDVTPQKGFFYLAFLPIVGFTYINNNLFGFLGPLVANEVQRLGLTPRLLRLYVRLVGPVVLVDCLLTVTLLLGLFSTSYWPRLWVLPPAAGALLALGLWGSLYKAKPVAKSLRFGNMRNNTSTLMSILSISTGAALFFLPWWWARLLLAGAVVASAWWPVRAVLRNDGPLRRRLWRGIGA